MPRLLYKRSKIGKKDGKRHSFEINYFKNGCQIVRARFNKRYKDEARGRQTSILFIKNWPNKTNLLGIRMIRNLEKLASFKT